MPLAILIVAASLTPSPSEADRNWGETLRQDARAIHAAIADSHPGMVNPDDPGFAAHNDAQLAIALDRAKEADNFADYFYAMQHYTASFDDAHLSFGVFGSTPDHDLRWPGFIARDDGEKGLVVTLSQPWSGVPVGAQLLSCNGLDAYHVGDGRQGARYGRWELATQRHRLGALVMLDTGDPYAVPIDRCRFATHDGEIDVALEWREGGDDFHRRYSIFPRPEQESVVMEQLEDGTYWVRLPSFNGNPESEAGQALSALVEEIEASSADLRQAPAIVFDLRGNGGGSSQWSWQIAEHIWGEGAFYEFPDSPMTVVWRASEGNLQSLRDGLARRDANGNLSPESRRWYNRSIAGLEATIAAGGDRWVIEPNLDGWQEENIPAYVAPSAEIYVLLDGACMSACLDAVDIWTRFGAVPIGRETGADTIYMEVRGVPVPSELGRMSMPMKYYVGRPRGHNESVKPAYRFEGDMSDTAALQKWVATLSEQQ